MRVDETFGMTSLHVSTEYEGCERTVVRSYWWDDWRYLVTVDCLGTERHSIIAKRGKWIS